MYEPDHRHLLLTQLLAAQSGYPFASGTFGTGKHCMYVNHMYESWGNAHVAGVTSWSSKCISCIITFSAAACS